MTDQRPTEMCRGRAAAAGGMTARRVVMAHRRTLSSIGALSLAWHATTPLHAQDATTAPVTRIEESEGWRWTVTGNVFAGFNYQYRKFTDFWSIESQNWAMLAGERRASTARFAATAMFSLEPLTLKRLGSPQVFQTGETFHGAPLIDYQHPHDFVMNLGVRYTRPIAGFATSAGAYIVGEPAFGPVPFMHRSSAAENPQVPLAHDYLDSVHVTPGVLTGGISRDGFAVEASWLRGREPDEHRWDLDVARLDSWAGRVSWSNGPWSLQVSGGHWKQPEVIEPFDVSKRSASVSYESGESHRPLAWTVAWGQNREFYGNKNAYLAEATWAASPTSALYGRAELVDKNILTAGGRHPIGFTHPHIYSRVGALTLGYVHDIASQRAGRIGVGGDATAYRVPANLLDNYGQPWSFHLFVRIRLGGDTHMNAGHVH